MNHRAGLDRSQTLLFPERLEDYIAAENPVRFLDAFVASLDLHPLGFTPGRRWARQDSTDLIGHIASGPGCGVFDLIRPPPPPPNHHDE